MFRFFPYALLYLVVAALQVAIFDRLLVSTMVAPLVYVTFVLLLPMQTSQLYMLLWGLFVGVSFDIFMGVAGINTIATLLVCYLRSYILSFTVGQDLMVLGGIPTANRVGWRRFALYTLVGVLLHSAVFFTMEFLNFEALMFLLCRILFSSVATLIFMWIIAGRFEQYISRKF